MKLLENAVEEYKEGVSAHGEIVNMIEYQDARGFVHVAVERFGEINNSIEENKAQEL